MKANIGPADRVIRVIAGLVILALGMIYRSWWGLIGLLPIVTASIRFCPPYALFGISTCKPETKEPPIPPGGPKPA